MLNVNKKYFWAVLLFLPLFLTWTFDHSLWSPDEMLDGGIAREMFVEGNIAVPKLNGEVFLEKPPLAYWSCVAVYSLTRTVNAGTTRLPAALFGFLGILFTFLIGRRLAGDRVGFIAAAILATSVQYFKTSHYALTDSALAALLTGAFYFYLRGRFLLFILMVAGAFYAEGFGAVALAGLVVGGDLIAKKRPARLVMLVLTGVPVFALVAAPWVYFLWKAVGQEFLRIFFVDNMFHRHAAQLPDFKEPFYYYLLTFPAGILPWTLFFAGAAYEYFVKGWRGLLDEKRRFAGLWFLLIFSFLSLSGSKRPIYFMSLFPAAALLCALWFEGLFIKDEPERYKKILVRVTMVLVTLAAAGLFGADVHLHKTVWRAALGAGVIGASVFFFKKFIAEVRYTGVFITLLLLFAFSLVSANLIFVGDMEQQKSFVPFVEAVRDERDLRRAKLAAYDLSEMERGVFTFYLNDSMLHFKTMDQLKIFLSTHQNADVLVVANRNKEEELKASVGNSLDVVSRFRPREKIRSYILFAGATMDEKASSDHPLPDSSSGSGDLP